MPTSTESRSEQVSLRVAPATKRILTQGASIAGQSLTDFMVACSAQKARELVEQHRVIAMSQTAFDTFVAALDEPATREATPTAKKIIGEYAAGKREDGSFDW